VLAKCSNEAQIVMAVEVQQPVSLTSGPGAGASGCWYLRPSSTSTRQAQRFARNGRPQRAGLSRCRSWLLRG
jgi:hypothetical protein